MRRTLFALWTTLMASCSYLPFAGGKLEGELTNPPEDWNAVGETRIVQLETRPGDPYSVKVWVIGSGDLLYVYAGTSHSTWVQHIEADPRVRLAAGGRVYELEAVRETDTERFERFAQAWKDKYGSGRALGETPDSAYLFRLGVRS
ncbi:MAG: nitroreductase/quinone reductase family protein [Pseudomonadota bacterium]